MNGRGKRQGKREERMKSVSSMKGLDNSIYGNMECFSNTQSFASNLTLSSKCLIQRCITNSSLLFHKVNNIKHTSFTFQLHYLLLPTQRNYKNNFNYCCHTNNHHIKIYLQFYILLQSKYILLQN